MIAFGPGCDLNPQLDHAEFFSQVQWDPAAPKTLMRPARAGDWQQAVLHLTRPVSGRRSAARSPSRDTVKLSLWSLCDLESPSRARRLVAAWQEFGPQPSIASHPGDRGTNGRKAKVGADRRRSDGPHELAAAVEEWLASEFEDQAASPFELLVAFEILGDAGALFPIDLRARLWRTMLTFSVGRSKEREPSAARAGAAVATTESLGKAALEAELAWEAGLLFAPVAGAAEQRNAGRDRLWRLLEDSSDAQGVPAAGSLHDLPVWMISLVRAREWGSRFGRPLFNVSQEKRVRGLVEATAKFCRDDGRPALADSEANGLSQVWSTAAARFPVRLQKSSPAVNYLCSLSRERANGRATANVCNRSRRKRLASQKQAPPVFQSDESRVACLRSDWSPQANSVVISHSGRFPALEMSVGGTTLFAGLWEIEVRIDGRAADPGAWTCSCWNSDEEGDYFELQGRTAGLCVERQIFLSRKDEFALFADAVSSESDARVESIARLPLAGECAAVAQTSSREYGLQLPGARVRTFPLALNCRREESAAGQLSILESRIELIQSGQGRVYAPLVLDWNPRLRRSRVAWRRLTVAQNGASVPPSRAAGFLLESGPSKWLIYRSLSPSLEPRSVLGQHTMYETMVGRFVRGDVEPIVRVEPAAKGGE